MKYASLILLCAFNLTIASAFGKGDDLKVYENNGYTSGIWDHESDFYLVFRTAKHPDLWAHLQNTDEKTFEGVVVKNQYAPNEKRAAAEARLIEAQGKRKLFELTFKFDGEESPNRVLIEKIVE